VRVIGLVFVVTCMTFGLAGCSSVGLGLAHHPLDCAMGIAWADCEPGTPGYNKGGGQLTRAEETKDQIASINAQKQAVATQCEVDLRSPALDPIRKDVEVLRPWDGPAPLFEIASNNRFPTEAERDAIAVWATIRDVCIRRQLEIATVPQSASSLSTVVLQQDASYGAEAAARVSELVVGLYQGKLTYGEFAQKRYEIGHNAAAAEREFRQAVAIADQDQRAREMRLAQEQFRNNVAAWSAYTQAVGARQPYVPTPNTSVTTNCTTLGHYTNCKSQ
jgi:hypothetical protein